MKQSKTAWVLILLLVLLLAGGSVLYRQLTAPAAEPETETAAVPRHTPTPAEPRPAPEESPAPTGVIAAETAADFTVYDEAGNAVSLSDYFGKPIVVNFWATWCPPCRAELPDFDEAAAKYGDQVVFLMVNLTDGYRDTVESATAFAREDNGFSFPLYFDLSYSGVEACQVNAIPVTLFIRADGSLLYQQIGMIDGAALEDYLEQLLS